MDPVNAQQQLTPQSAKGEVSLSFTVAEHAADTLIAFRDARTALQLSALYYQAAAGQLLIEIPNFVIEDISVSEDDKARLEVKCVCARNGMGSSYSNSNMAFVSPVRVTLTNS
jgi:hypothetical protein